MRDVCFAILPTPSPSRDVDSEADKAVIASVMPQYRMAREGGDKAMPQLSAKLLMQLAT